MVSIGGVGKRHGPAGLLRGKRDARVVGEASPGDANADCRGLLTDSPDDERRPLVERLVQGRETRGTSLAAGHGQRHCALGIAVFAEVGHGVKRPFANVGRGARLAEHRHADADLGAKPLVAVLAHAAEHPARLLHEVG